MYFKLHDNRITNVCRKIYTFSVVDKIYPQIFHLFISVDLEQSHLSLFDQFRNQYKYGNSFCALKLVRFLVINNNLIVEYAKVLDKASLNQTLNHCCTMTSIGVPH